MITNRYLALASVGESGGREDGDADERRRRRRKGFTAFTCRSCVYERELIQFQRDFSEAKKGLLFVYRVYTVVCIVVVVVVAARAADAAEVAGDSCAHWSAAFGNDWPSGRDPNACSGQNFSFLLCRRINQTLVGNPFCALMCTAGSLDQKGTRRRRRGRGQNKRAERRAKGCSAPAPRACMCVCVSCER